MNTCIIDLPKNLQPARFIEKIEELLPQQSIGIVRRCKSANNLRDAGSIEQVVQELNAWCGQHSDRLGAAVASLWLADFHWGNWETLDNTTALENVLDYCDAVTAYLPGIAGVSLQDAPAPPRIAAPLRGVLSGRFNMNELLDLCQDLNVDYLNLPKEKDNLVRELIGECERRGIVDDLIDLCQKARTDIYWRDVFAIPPIGQKNLTLASTLTRATALYMSGLSYQIQGNIRIALKSYRVALESFQAAQQDRERILDNEGARAFDHIIKWVTKLIQYTEYIQSEPLATAKLICPCEHDDQDYIRVELPLTEHIRIEDIPGKTAVADFLHQREKQQQQAARLRIGNMEIEGYKIKLDESIRVFEANNCTRHFTLNPLTMNPAAVYDNHLIVPTGVKYHLFQFDTKYNVSPLPIVMPVKVGDYLIGWSETSRIPERFVMFCRTNGVQTIMLERRLTVLYFKRSLESEKGVVGVVDFTLELFQGTTRHLEKEPVVYIIGGQGPDD